MFSTLTDGLYFGEGPRWHDNRLWFSDFYDHTVQAVDSQGNKETIVRVDNQPSGLGWMPDGSLLIVSMIDRKVLRYDGTSLSTHADLSHIAGFHCNDMVVDQHGRAYVGNFGFDLMNAFATGDIRPFDQYPKATLARIDPDGSVHAAATDMMFPNGSVITPDGRTLIVAETLGGRLTAFDIATDGSLGGRRVWADVAGRSPDGICLDASGAVWFADAVGSAVVRVAEGGEILEVKATPKGSFACMLGGATGKTLHVVVGASAAEHEARAARTGEILTVEVESPGAGWP